MAERYSTQLLQEKLERIYKSLEGLEFEGCYEKRHLMKSTGEYRDVLSVTESSTKVNEALEDICENLEEETFAGEKLSNIVWKGITGGKYSGYEIWVQVPWPDSGGYDIQEYCEIGETYRFKLDTPSVDIFRDLDWKVPGYKAGVNIYVNVC